MIFAVVIPTAIASQVEDSSDQRLQERAGITVTTGLTQWQVIQRNPAGLGTIRCGGMSTRDGEVWARVLQHTRPIEGLGWRKAVTATDGTFSAAVRDIPTGGPYSIEFRVGEPDPDAFGALGVIFWFGVLLFVADTCAVILLTPIYPEMLPNLVAALFGWRIAPFWLAAAPFWLAGLAALLMALQAVRDERALRLAPPHCSRCGYDLTGNLSGTCPECGYTLPLEPPAVKR